MLIGRQVAAVGRQQAVARDLGCHAAGDQAGVLLHRGGHPGVLAGRIRAQQRHIVARTGQAAVALAGDGAQQILLSRQRALGGDHRRGGAVARGAGDLDIGDRDQADLVALLGLIELDLHRLQCSSAAAVSVSWAASTAKYCVRTRCTRLCCGGQIIRLALRDRGVGRLERHPAVPGEQVHRQGQPRGTPGS